MPGSSPRPHPIEATPLRPVVTADDQPVEATPNRPRRGGRRDDDRGEGVVSAAIVVLIMAALGALMWVGFQEMWTNIEDDTNEKISEVGT